MPMAIMLTILDVLAYFMDVEMAVWALTETLPGMETEDLDDCSCDLLGSSNSGLMFPVR